MARKTERAPLVLTEEQSQELASLAGLAGSLNSGS